MGKLSSLLKGMAIGAGLMYFYDPQQGKRRKAMVRDQAYRLRNKGDEALEIGVNDLRNRVRGLLAEGMALVSNETMPDEILGERVRARLGMLSRHPKAVQVSVQNGQVVLEGDILEDEVEMLTRGLMRVRGVSGVENRLRAHASAGDVPQLQGEGWLPQSGQWSPSTRLLASGGAAYLLLYSILRGGFIGFIARIGGLGLLIRALSNMSPRQLAGSGMEQGMLRVNKSIHINAPVEEVYTLWSNFENFSQFMHNVESIHMMGDRSHWVVKGPAGSKVEFEGITTAMVPNELVSWETTPESMVKHSGRVSFRESGGGTQVNVSMAYTPPAGVVGHAVASLFGKDPKSEMDADLARMKSLLEKGRTTAGGKKVTRDEVTAGLEMQEQQGGRKQNGGRQSKKNRQQEREGSTEEASVPVTGAEAADQGMMMEGGLGEMHMVMDNNTDLGAVDYGGSEMGSAEGADTIGDRSRGEITSDTGLDVDASEGAEMTSTGIDSDEVSENIRRDMGGGEENSPQGSGQV